MVLYMISHLLFNSSKCMSIHGFSVKRKISSLILWMRDTYNLCENWVTHRNSNDLIHILFCFINMCFQLLQLFKLIWEKYLKTNCQRWMFHHLILMLLMFLYTMRGIFKKNYKGGRSDWFQGLLCLPITGPLFVVHSCFCQAPGSLREGGLWIKLIKLFWTKSDNNSMVVSVHAIEGKSAM